MPHVDGLRAVAILPVVAYHADISRISGGFTGVDIFFVISGFLLTGIAITELRRGEFTLLGFYRRRALRILPAYVAVILSVAAVGALLLLPSENHSLGLTIAAASAFVSNIYFWKVTNYFNPDSAFEPLLHTWTLSVEEQFYIVLPIFLLIVWRFCRSWLALLLAAAVLGSFALSVWGVTRFETAAFYLLPFRAWEFAIGGLLACLGGFVPRGAVLREIGTAVGFLLAIAGFVLLGPKSVFPGVNALLPVLGAVLLIACAAGTRIGAILESAPAVFFGKISYSLYLWHWPLIVFYKMRFGSILGPLDQVVIFASSVALAYLSYRFVEQPFRTSQARATPAPRVVLGALSCLAILVASGAAFSKFADRLRPYPPEIAALDAYRNYPATPDGLLVTDAKGCMLHRDVVGGFDGFDKERCLAPSASKRPTWLVAGDSHAAHMIDAIEQTYPDLHVQRAVATYCAPVLGTPRFPPGHFCSRLMDYVFSEHLAKAHVDGIVMSARWWPEDIEPLMKTVDFLQGRVKNIIILGPTVEYEGRFPQILARAGWMGSGEDFTRFRRPLPWKLDAELAARQWPANVTYVSMLHLICPKDAPDGDACRHQAADGAPYHFDYAHYTFPAALELARRIEPLATAAATASASGTQTQSDAVPAVPARAERRLSN